MVPDWRTLTTVCTVVVCCLHLQTKSCKQNNREILVVVLILQSVVVSTGETAPAHQIAGTAAVYGQSECPRSLNEEKGSFDGQVKYGMFCASLVTCQNLGRALALFHTPRPRCRCMVVTHYSYYSYLPYYYYFCVVVLLQQ